MNARFLVLLFSIGAVLAGCSSVSKIDCLAADWQQMGFNNGQNGIAPTTDSLQESCSEPSAAVDIGAYNVGHEKGLALFCQVEKGFDVGMQGKEYSVACPAEFKAEYDIGYKFYIATNNIRLIEKAIMTSNADVGKLQSGISRANSQLSSTDLTPTEENQIRQNISSMESQIISAEQALVRLEPLLGQSRRNLATLKSYYGK